MIDKESIPLEEITAYCKSVFPEEACGVITVSEGNYKFHPCPNVSLEDKTGNFTIHPLDFAKAADSGEVVAVVHSHTQHPTVFSNIDRAYQRKQGIPWLLIGLMNENVETVWLEGSKEVLPLYGRNYVWHVTDCYSFVRDWYKSEMGIALPDFQRKENFWKDGQEIYLDNFEQAGFVEVPAHTMQYGDVLLMQLAGNITSHGAIYLGNNVIGHHLPKRLSSKDVLGQFYIQRITKVVRHKEAFK